MSKNYAVAVLDLGTTGVRMLVGRINENGQPKFIAKAECPCHGGIRKIGDNGNGGLAEAISTVLDTIKTKTGLVVKSAYVSLRNGSVELCDSEGTIEINEPGKTVDEDDLGDLLNTASAIDVDEDERIIDIIPLGFYADKKFIKDNPIGTPCKNLKIEASVAVAKDEELSQIEAILESVGLEVDGYIPGFLACQKAMPAAYFGVNDKTKPFTLVADVGGDITDYAVYYNGIPFVLGTDYSGGMSITRDISIVLGITMNEAERLKQEYSLADPDLAGDLEIAVFPTNKQEKEMVKVSYIAEIIKARVVENVKKIKKQAEEKMAEKGVPEGSLNRFVLMGQGISEFSGLAGILENDENLTYEVVNFGKDIGMKNSYSISTGMALYICSYISYGRKSSKIMRVSYDEQNDGTGNLAEKEKKSIMDTVKGWLSLFKE